MNNDNSHESTKSSLGIMKTTWKITQRKSSRQRESQWGFLKQHMGDTKYQAKQYKQSKKENEYM